MTSPTRPIELSHLQLILYLDAACLTAVVWDVLCLLPQEITLIWKGRWNLLKTLYVVLRLLPLASFVAYMITWDDMPHPDVTTSILPLPQSFVLCLNLVFVEAFLALRVRAIWNKNLAVTVTLVISLLFVLAIVLSLSFTPFYLTSYLVNYVLFAAFYTLMLVLTCIRAKQSMPYHHRTLLLKVVYRDGILYYSLILSFSLAEVVSDLSSAPYLLTVCLQRIIQFLSSVLAARITLTMKEADHRTMMMDEGELTELVHNVHIQDDVQSV